MQLVVAFFLIYTIPAAAIGGIPGGLAIGARSARCAQPARYRILAVVFVVLWIWLPELCSPSRSRAWVIGYFLVRAAVSAIVFAYLAFPFATYDDIAFRGYW